MPKQSSGFTLLEILLVVAAIAVLAGIVIVAINPGRQLGETRNTARRSDVDSVLNALYQYSLDNRGLFPSSTDTNLRMLGTSVTGCAINCGGTASNANSTSSQQSTPTSFLDNSQSTFAGSFSNTSYSNNLLSLSSGQTSGSYTSDVKDAGGSATWSNFSWVPSRPTGKPLPNSSATESGYPNGNMDMNGNVLLLHMDEGNGATTFSDSSGSGNDGGCKNPKCPNMTSGKIGGAANFSLGSNPISVSDNSSLDLTNQFTIALWFFQTPDTGWTDYGHMVGKGIGYWYSSGSFSISEKSKYLRTFLVEPNGKYYNYQDGGWVVDNVWTHFVFTFNNGLGKMYFNGALKSTKTFPFTSIRTNNLPIQVGYGQYNGLIDEVSLFSRSLSADEVSDMYQRGALSLKYQVKSCAVADCSDGNFVGPDGTNNSYYSENNNSSNTTPSFSLSNITDNRYFQYKSFLDTNNQTLTPEMKSVSISGTQTSNNNSNSTSTPTVTTDSCLDLSSVLVNKYITAIPFDPKIGSAEKTYYAIRKTSGNRMNVIACSPENNESINVTR